MARLLWIGTASPGTVTQLKRTGYDLVHTNLVEEALGEIRSAPPDVVILDKESCLHGELAAVKLKSAAPKVPILLLCEPRDSAVPQVFFVNMILSSSTAPEQIERAISSLIPARHERHERTGT